MNRKEKELLKIKSTGRQFTLVYFIADLVIFSHANFCFSTHAQEIFSFYCITANRKMINERKQITKSFLLETHCEIVQRDAFVVNAATRRR